MVGSLYFTNKGDKYVMPVLIGSQVLLTAGVLFVVEVCTEERHCQIV